MSENRRDTESTVPSQPISSSASSGLGKEAQEIDVGGSDHVAQNHTIFEVSEDYQVKSHLLCETRADLCPNSAERKITVYIRDPLVPPAYLAFADKFGLPNTSLRRPDVITELLKSELADSGRNCELTISCLTEGDPSGYAYCVKTIKNLLPKSASKIPLTIHLTGRDGQAAVDLHRSAITTNVLASEEKSDARSYISGQFHYTISLPKLGMELPSEWLESPSEWTKRVLGIAMRLTLPIAIAQDHFTIIPQDGSTRSSDLLEPAPDFPQFFDSQRTWKDKYCHVPKYNSQEAAKAHALVTEGK